MKGLSYLFSAFLCLLAGSVIYLLYSPSVVFIHSAFSGSVLIDLRENLQWVRRIFPDSGFTRHHLPDILWYQSLLFVLFYFYHIKKVFNIGLVYYFSLCLPFLLEFLQLPHIIPGTFDWLDLFFYFILLFLNYFFYIRKKKFYEK